MAKMNLDFTNVSTFINCEEGEHFFVIKEADIKAYTKQDKTQGTRLELKLECLNINNDASAGAIVYHSMILTDNSLGVLKFLLEKIYAQELPKGAFTLDTATLVGRNIQAVITHEEYTTSTGASAKRPKIDNVFSDLRECKQAPPTENVGAVMNSITDDDFPFN